MRFNNFIERRGSDLINAPVGDPVSVCGHFFIFLSIDEANDKNRTIIIIIIFNRGHFLCVSSGCRHP